MEYAKKIGIIIITGCTFVGIILLPLHDHQMSLWQIAIVTTLFGDSATTALIGRFGMEEQHGYTRKVCGAQPSLLCSVLTRGLILVVAGGV